MAQNIGALAAQTVNRESTIALLNTCADEVPYATLFEEDARLGSSIQAIESQCSQVEGTLTAELQRLEGLASTFATKMPGQLEAAKALVEQKKKAAIDEAKAQKAKISDPRTELAENYEQLGLTLDSVLKPWPVPPYSEDVLEAVARKRDEAQAAEEALDEESALPPPIARILPKRREQLLPTKEKVLGPHADLADSIPSLSEVLMPAISEHSHVYGDVETAAMILDRAAAKPQAEKTEEEDFLAKAVHVLRRRFLVNPNDLGFLQVYEASDVIELTRRLRTFSRKNRPDFNHLEGQILDKAAEHIPLRGKDVPKDVQGAIDRMNDDSESRTGMTWHSLAKHASRACDTMRARFFAGGALNTHLKHYTIEVADRSETKPDISWIYQFVADNFAFDILAQRRSEQQASTKERFIKNCKIITQWLEESGDLLGQLPKDFRLTRYHQGKRNFRRHQTPKTQFENATARTSILNMIQDIEIRRTGQGDDKVPRHKPVDFDPQGALNHQLRLGKMIDLLKEELAIYDVPTDSYTEEITPFE